MACSLRAKSSSLTAGASQGAPGTKGAAGSGVYLSPNQELMMPLAAQNKEGAWAFLAFLLNDRYLVSPFSGGFLPCRGKEAGASW